MSLYPTTTVIQAVLSAASSQASSKMDLRDHSDETEAHDADAVVPDKSAPEPLKKTTAESFVTVKKNLLAPQSDSLANQLQIADNVTRSRSFIVGRSHSDKEETAAQPTDQADELTASVTDVRVHIHRESSFSSVSTITNTPRTNHYSRVSTGSISYVAWEDTDMGLTGRRNHPPQKMWTEDALLKFGQTAYHDENLSQITDYLYVGDIYAANNDHLMCRLSIDAIVDMSDLRPEGLRKLKACHIPCTCPMSTNHQRAKLIIGVKNSESEEIHIYFDEINRFIESIRRSGRKVLIHSVRGQGRSAVAIIQYLMQVHMLPMHAAFRVVKLARSLNINPGFREVLEFLEIQLRTEGKLPPAQNKNRIAARLVHIP